MLFACLLALYMLSDGNSYSMSTTLQSGRLVDNFIRFDTQMCKVYYYQSRRCALFLGICRVRWLRITGKSLVETTRIRCRLLVIVHKCVRCTSTSLDDVLFFLVFVGSKGTGTWWQFHSTNSEIRAKGLLSRWGIFPEIFGGRPGNSTPTNTNKKGTSARLVRGLG